MILETIGWFLVGVVAAAFLVTFWDEIRAWLNNVAADAVEKALGYKARERMHRAIAVVDRVVNKVRNVATIYTKRNSYDTYYDKTTIIAEADYYEIDERVLREVEMHGKIIQEFEYRR